MNMQRTSNVHRKLLEKNETSGLIMFNFSTHATAAVSSGMWGCCKERRVDERADGPGDEPHTCAQLTAVGEGRCPLGRNKTLASPSHHTRK